MYLSFWVQRYSKIPELLLHGIRGKFHIFLFLHKKAAKRNIRALFAWVPELRVTIWEGDFEL